MKSKIINNPGQEPEGSLDHHDENKVEIDAGGPGIAAAKKSKVAIIAASSILVTLVLYFMFFKDDDGSNKKKEKLEEVANPIASIDVAPSDGKSFFEIDKNTKSNEDLELLKKPEAPQVPKLPELPADSVGSPLINVLIPQGDNNGQNLQQSGNQQNPNLNSNSNQFQNQFPGQNPQQNNADGNQQNNNSQNNNSSNSTSPSSVAKKELDPRYSPIIVIKGNAGASNAVGADGKPVASPSTANGVGYNENIVKIDIDGYDALEKTQVTTKTTYISDRTHTIAQGKLLNAVLETAINTELPGLVRGIVSRDVYGEAGNEILIPRGSRLFGSYSSKITRGQGRVEISWNRLIRPDGVDITITFNASDQFGRAGISGEIDNKYGSVIANSMLTSVLAVGSVAAVQKLLTNNATTVTTNNPQQGTVTTTGSASNQAIYDVSKTIVDTVGQVISNSLDLNPVIRVPQGTKITVIVNADINVPSMRHR